MHVLLAACQDTCVDRTLTLSLSSFLLLRCCYFAISNTDLHGSRTYCMSTS